MNLAEKALRAERILKTAAQMSKQYYEKPLIVCISGGKDSTVLLNLAEKALRADEFEVLNSCTTVDAPETIAYIKREIKRLRDNGYTANIHYPRYKDGSYASMWNLIPRKRMPPTRLVRYCCDVLKENSTPKRYIATGVRKDESSSRAGRGEFEIRAKTKADVKKYTLDHVQEVFQEAQEWDEVYDCQFITAAKQHKDLICNPIFDFTEKEIWQYIRENNLDYNPLYDRGYRRVGCIGCPLGGRKHQLKEFADYPAYKKAYIKAFDRMLQKRIADGLPTKWKSGAEVYRWWVNDPDIPGQLSFDEDGNIHKDD